MNVQSKGDNNMIKPQYLVDAENRAKRMKAIVDYIDNHSFTYNAAVEYAHKNWNRLVMTSMKDHVPIADQLEVLCGCPQYIAVDIARMVNTHKTIV